MELKNINKKGQLGGMATSIVVLTTAVIVLVIMLIIVQEMRDNTLISASESITTTNESLGNSSTAVAVAEATSPGFSGFTLTEVLGQRNQTGTWITIELANVSSNSSGYIIWIGDTELDDVNGTALNVSYTHNEGGETFTAANTSLVGLGTFGDFITIIVLAIVAGIVLGIIFGVFGRTGRR